ncbi:hypothetical protein GF380_02620 [Candidatus Uhrbacteria bacterium]|nr:hypothetical protein [Candidatus Uhrbacteria bacterium]
MEGITFRFDYLAMTIYCSLKRFMPYWNHFFFDDFGDLYDTERRTAFFEEMYQALAGVTICASPISPCKNGDHNYITLTLKGEACSCISTDKLAHFVRTLAKKVQFKTTRIDLAWDGLEFSPGELAEYIEENMHNHDNFRSPARRSSISIRRDPEKPDDKGNIGTSSITLGSRQSTRMLRVYDQHGFTRLEFQLMKERAQYVLADLSFREEERYQVGLSHLLDYIDLSWDKWRDFVGTTKRAELTLNDARRITEQRLKLWLQKQVAPALSAIQDVESNYVVKLLAHGRMRDRSKYQALMDDRGKKRE